MTDPTSPISHDLVLAGLPEFAAPGRVAPSMRGRSDWQYATVTAIHRETPRATTFRLEPDDWFPHVPGQHYLLRLTAPDGYTAQRHYSVASPPEDRGAVEITVDRVVDGEVSGFLHDTVRVGDRLELRGPLGGFFAWAGDRPALLVGGGSGLVPLMAMLRHRRSAALDLPLDLVVSARSPQDLLYADELAGTDATLVFTRSAPAGWPDPVGRLAERTLAPHAARALERTSEVYVCGANGFCEHVGRLLVRLGVPPTRIRIERFGG